MIPAIALLVLCSPIQALKVAPEAFKEVVENSLYWPGYDANAKQSCGIVMGAFGSKSYVDIGDKVINHIKAMKPPKGWCPEQPELDYLPIAYFTDLQGHVCPEGVRCFTDKDMTAWEGNAKSIGGGGAHLGSWKYRFFHSAMIAASPFDLTLYLDLDALPCGGDAIAQMFSVFKDGVTIGSILKPADPRPSGLTKCDQDLVKCAARADRNAGVIITDTRKTKQLMDDWGTEIKRIAGKADGDQAAYIKVIRDYIKRGDTNLKEHFFTSKQISRHQRDSCKTPGVLVHHSKHMTSLMAAGLVPKTGEYNPSR